MSTQKSSRSKRTATQADMGSTPSSPQKHHSHDSKRSRPSRETKYQEASHRHKSRSSQPAETLQLTEETGDIFNAPPNTLIIHACNCDGSWGAGIAAAFKTRYPKAFKIYRDHCDQFGGDLFETALLIPPVDAEASQDKDDATPDEALQFNLSSETPGKHFIGCLFTSHHYGRRRDSPGRILDATAPAMVDLLRQVRKWNSDAESGEEVGEVRMCKINSGLFAVPWGKTKDVLEEIDVERSGVKEVRVFSPAEKPAKRKGGRKRR